MEGTSEFLVDTALDAAGTEIKSGDDIIEDIIDTGLNEAKEVVKDATVRKTVQPAGLNVADDD